MYRLACKMAVGKLLVGLYSSTAIAVSIVSSTLGNVGFVENKTSLRTWAMRPCCASTAIFVLRVGQLWRSVKPSEADPYLSLTLFVS